MCDNAKMVFDDNGMSITYASGNEVHINNNSIRIVYKCFLCGETIGEIRYKYGYKYVDENLARAMMRDERFHCGYMCDNCYALLNQLAKYSKE